MGRPYSQDLRQRVVEAAAASSRRQAADRFDVGASSAIRWVALAEATGGVAPRPQGRPPGSKLDEHEAFLLGLIEEQDDITLEEMLARLEAERGLKAGLGTLWRFLDARGLTFKKSPRTRPSRNGLM